MTSYPKVYRGGIKYRRKEDRLIQPILFSRNPNK
jgi:hypothetical protein